MASNTFMDDHGNEFSVEERVYGYTEPEVRISEDSKVAIVGYLTKNDGDEMNPRKCLQNLGTMVCFHDKYTLGDKHAYSDRDDFLQSLAHSIDSTIEDSIESLNNDKYEELTNQGLSHDSAIDIVNSNISDLIKETIDGSGAVLLPLYLHDHSGLSMNTTGFSDRWDSGQMGYIYVTSDKIEAEYGDRSPQSVEKAINVLKGEVEEYDSYLRGEVFDCIVELHENVSEDGEAQWQHLQKLELPWAVIGEDNAKSQMEEMVQAHAHDLGAMAQAVAERQEMERDASQELFSQRVPEADLALFKMKFKDSVTTIGQWTPGPVDDSLAMRLGVSDSEEESLLPDAMVLVKFHAGSAKVSKTAAYMLDSGESLLEESAKMKIGM